MASSSSPSVSTSDTKSGATTATPSTSATNEEAAATVAVAVHERNEVSKNNQRHKHQKQLQQSGSRHATDYVDISKHLTNDPMADLLTDTHITNFLEICVDYFDGRDKIKKFRFVNPTFFESPYAIEDVTNFVQDFDENISVLFIPVCYHTHWVLFVLRPKSWTLEIYNSLENIVIPVLYKHKVNMVCGFLFKSTRRLRVEQMNLPKCLQQKDGINCGIFLCVYIEQIIRYGKICDVVKFNIEEERLRLDWIFFEVRHTLAKPSFWPPFSGEPILAMDLTESSTSSESEDSEDDEFESSEEDSEDHESLNFCSVRVEDVPSSVLIEEIEEDLDQE